MQHHFDVIARIHTDFPTKFGIPRQSGLVEELKAEIVMEPAYRDPAAVRGLEGFSHIWLIWNFSESEREGWSAAVTPPRLGGKKRMGVFATRSPFRPNPIGLSCVRLEEILFDHRGTVLRVSGADLMDGTPIYDIKPYLPLSDCHPDASAGFAENTAGDRLQVIFPQELAAMIPEDRLQGLIAALRGDPRPGYQNDPTREYGFNFMHFDVRFCVADGVLTVTEIEVL
ncbi:MAG: tRNA (N6-threonylcarbamoyladenosine(37)-N6)-methyltransferase TrmO [Clostridia bacterium]|nr:tRNA (N6-threonylcarbamoyladenosine(37)-N6)-methyltransferase TrmO [Clostridia bacterium]MBQ1963723.1 tRNA (N6-threonylcarbamoyladenosine(37)-N6)-methyltransferase TrmO [Clostridia bacterium]MBQ5833554.1 tRNA (N6-threonylcarbamoyladenosine(37)-N6)-methyltransferase TrmO [Clostridia bacterium]